MKKLYFLIMLAGFSFSGNAQIVNIPDANFKNKLVNSNCVLLFNTAQGSGDADTNNDGEIQVSEAQNVLILDVSDAGIASMAGIEAFTNITQLDCQGNNVTSLDLSALTHLSGLQCSNNQISFLDISNMTMNTDGSGTFVTASNNLLTSIAFPPAITYWDFIGVGGNPLTSLPLPLTNIYEINASNTTLESIDFSQTMVNTVAILNNNPNLQYINVKNSSIDFCVGFDCGFMDGPTWHIENCPNLLMICVDDLSMEGVTEAEAFQALAGPNVSVNTYCTFTPGGDYNTITGTLTIDIDGNGCTSSDPGAANSAIGLFSGTTQFGTLYSMTNGFYTFYTPTNVTLTPTFENPYYNVSPASYSSSFSGSGNSATADFCISPNGIHPDLNVSIMALSPARPGFDASYRIHFENKGTETQSGTVTLTFEDDIMDFVSSNPALSAQAANSLSWNFSNLIPFESREIALTLNVNSPLETPAVNIGDVLDFTAAITAGDDETPADNVFALHQTVVGSYDPNDKAVSRERIGIAQLGDYLYYTVRFQNTGTFYAENVVVKDMLSGNLDLSTLQMVSASHPYRSMLTAGNRLEFFFEGINLPAVGDDEPASHGYVTFKVKPKNTLVVDDTIENSANIYFDFNAPITTNVVTTTVEELGAGEFESDSFILYPNPAKNTLSIRSDATIDTIIIRNALGQLVKKASGQTMVEVSDLAGGSYFVEITSGKLKTIKKLIKL